MTLERVSAEDSIPWVNATGDETYDKPFPELQMVQRQLANWVSGIQTDPRRAPSLFNRQAYVAPDNPYALMNTARLAVENDDVVGGVCDVSEGLMLQGIKWEAEDHVTADVFNQNARDLNLDDFVRQWHREEFTFSQVIMGIWWGQQDYKVRGKSDAGNKRRQTVSAFMPTALTFLDPMRVIPMPPGPFGQDRLAWHASPSEMSQWNAAKDGGFLDPVFRQFTTGQVIIDDVFERELMSRWHVNPDRLLGLNPSSVFRFCRTKMSYERFPQVRLKSTFPLLDLKQQLLEADRVSLVGSANFILLVKQGSKEEPATQNEIDNLKENFKVVAKLPVVVGDHRLAIEIITPNQEFTLDAAKYDTIDRRLMGRTLGALTVASAGQRNESTVTIARGVARQLEARRQMMRRALELTIARAVTEHPLNDGLFPVEPNLAFTPKNVQLDEDAEITKSMMALRTQNEISRETVLEYFGIDQLTEAMRREFEDKSGLDDIFKTQVPFSTPNPGAGDPNAPAADPNAPAGAEASGEPAIVSGARGGRPKGGGDSPKSPQGQMKK